jgi:hypothetical protein
MSIRRMLAGFVAAAALGSGCSAHGGPPTVAAVVEGVKIPASETEALIRSYRTSQEARKEVAEQASGIEDGSLEKFVLLYQIKLAFLDVLADRMSVPRAVGGAPELATQVDSPDTKDVIRSAVAGGLSKSMAEKLFPDVQANDADLRREYDRRAALNNGFWRVNAKVASFTAADPARQFVARVRQGQPFEPAGESLGGRQIGTVDITPVSPLPKPIVDAVEHLREGQMADPIELPTGTWACILAERRQDLPLVSFDEVRPELASYLVDQQRQVLFQDWFDKKLRAAHVRISGHYGSWDREKGTVR